MDLFQAVELVLPLLSNESAEVAARDKGAEALLELGGAAGAFASVFQLLEHLMQRAPVQRRGFFWAGCLTQGFSTALT